MAAVVDGVRRTVSSDDLLNLMAKKLEKKGTLRRITSEVLAQHNTKTDGWIAYHGKVYDITKHIEELEQSAMGKTSTLLVKINIFVHMNISHPSYLSHVSALPIPF